MMRDINRSSQLLIIRDNAYDSRSPHFRFSRAAYADDRILV